MVANQVTRILLNVLLRYIHVRYGVVYLSVCVCVCVCVCVYMYSMYMYMYAMLDFVPYPGGMPNPSPGSLGLLRVTTPTSRCHTHPGMDDSQAEVFVQVSPPGACARVRVRVRVCGDLSLLCVCAGVCVCGYLSLLCVCVGISLSCVCVWVSLSPVCVCVW